MTIAFITIFDAKDINRGSGTFYHMAKELERQGQRVHYVGPISFSVPFGTKVLAKFHSMIGKRYVLFLDPGVGKRTGRVVAERLRAVDYDVMLTNDLSIAAYTRIDKPIVSYSDVMITRNYMERTLPYTKVGNLSPISLYFCRRTIRAALKNAALNIFPADWSANEAQYYAPGKKGIHVIPFGANVDDPGRKLAENRRTSLVSKQGRIDLLFVGKEWARKGGDIAVHAVRMLHEGGLDAHLHVVGSKPEYGVDPSYIHLYGLLDKRKESERESIDALYTNADLFILPSSSEGFVISILEAAAYALPTLAFNTIGVNQAVIDGTTGYLLPLGVGPETFAAKVQELIADQDTYGALALGARAHYEKTTNWKNSIQALLGLIRNHLCNNDESSRNNVSSHRTIA